MRTKLQGVEERIETPENTGIHKRKSKTRKKIKLKENFQFLPDV